ncbi:MAG: hypothetical protein E5Y81_21510, partial [Mesorhizobium sp.]
TLSATTNGWGPSTGTIEVFTPPSSGPNVAKKAVEVIVHQTLDRFFTSIFSQSAVGAQARAVALITDASKACVLALNPSASRAALFSGSSNLKLTGCSVMSQAVKYLGNFSGQGGCTQVVADTIEWSGATSIKQDCTSLGMREIPSAQSVHLVE